MRSMHGRVVVLTGASAGIGRAAAQRLVRAGATVVGCAREESRLRSVAQDVGMRAYACDIGVPEEREGLIASVLAEHGRIDVLVNNAGLGWVGLVESMQADDVARLYATNVIGTVDLTRRVLPGMLARGDGDVVMVSSGAAFVALPPLTVYSSTKWAVDGFVEGLRREVLGRGVRVHSVNPGPVRTEWLARAAGYQPEEGDSEQRLSPGVPADRVAAAVERVATSGYSRTVSVPRVVGLGRLLGVQPLRAAVDIGVGLSSGRLASRGRRMAAVRAAPLPDDERQAQATPADQRS